MRGLLLEAGDGNVRDGRTKIMPAALILVSVVGLVFFGSQMLTDPAGWATNAVGVAACLFVITRNATVIGSNRKIMSTAGLRDIHDPATLDEALASERAILYKHSTSCPISAWVIQEVLEFAETHADWPIYLLKVIEQRALSDTVAERLEVRHQSPQAFVIKEGRCAWHASHSAITAESLSTETA